MSELRELQRMRHGEGRRLSSDGRDDWERRGFRLTHALFASPASAHRHDVLLIGQQCRRERPVDVARHIQTGSQIGGTRLRQWTGGVCGRLHRRRIDGSKGGSAEKANCNGAEE